VFAGFWILCKTCLLVLGFSADGEVMKYEPFLLCAYYSNPKAEMKISYTSFLQVFCCMSAFTLDAFSLSLILASYIRVMTCLYIVSRYTVNQRIALVAATSAAARKMLAVRKDTSSERKRMKMNQVRSHMFFQLGGI
jgi:hypothetical protein